VESQQSLSGRALGILKGTQGNAESAPRSDSHDINAFRGIGVVQVEISKLVEVSPKEIRSHSSTNPTSVVKLRRGSTAESLGDVTESSSSDRIMYEFNGPEQSLV
jgi:hypothetical protein